MSLSYVPFKGDAGIVKISLIKVREGKVPIVPDYLNTIYLNVTEFSEDMEESSMNETFEDINGNAHKNHFGYRQVISFSAVNANNMPIPAGSTKTNRRAIQELITMINAINLYPKNYNLRVQYRDDTQLSVMSNVIYTGLPSVNELIKDANIAQDIKFQFKAKSLSEPDFGLELIDPVVFIEEDTTTDTVILTTELEEAFINQVNAYNTTP